MKTLILAAVAAASLAAPAFAQTPATGAPNDAATTLRQGENYSKAKGLTPTSHASSHSASRRSTSGSRTSAPNADNSADQLNAKQLGTAGGS
jgi:hypothetical protein